MIAGVIAGSTDSSSNTIVGGSTVTGPGGSGLPDGSSHSAGGPGTVTASALDRVEAASARINRLAEELTQIARGLRCHHCSY